MKKTVLLIVSTLLLMADLSAQQGLGTLTGTVTDSADGKPLAGVSVFLNSTSIGTSTHADGAFTLPGIPRGKYQLVVSAIGYGTTISTINASLALPTLIISLSRRPTELEAVTVEPFLKDGWEKWGKFFLDNFIGTGENARSCTIVNRDALRFHFHSKNNMLTVTATEPLIIENMALGYTLEYRMTTFSSDFEAHLVTYFGYPFFREMSATRETRRQRWEQHRKEAYAGSILHFMRSLYDNQLAEAGFIVQQDRKVPNIEKQRIENRTVRLTTDSLLTVQPVDTKGLFFRGTINVLFGDAKKRIPYRGSSIRLLTPATISIEENGSYFPPEELLSTGFWAGSEKIANLLPMEYGRN